MAKKGKLLLALDAEKGRDYEAEKRKKQVKSAEKRKRTRTEAQLDDDDDGDEDKENMKSLPSKTVANSSSQNDFEDFNSKDEESHVVGGKSAIGNGSVAHLQGLASGDGSASEAEEESDVPFSDLEEEDREDAIPHQRMTINNGPALFASRKRISIVSDKPKQPFHNHNSLISSDKTADELIPDAMDDETRELMFYKIARDATVTARKLLKMEKIPFARPEDYFAEMVKSDEHMGKIKKKLHDEAASKKASEEARKLRDAKKFGKQVQIAKEQERAKERKNTMNKIQELKRKRKGVDSGRVTEGDDLFQEIDVEDDTPRDKSGGKRGPGQGPAKRQKKDAKFGFGGKKRFSKSGTAESTSDMRSFSAKKMKGKGSGKSTKRPGKSRRVAGRS